MTAPGDRPDPVRLERDRDAAGRPESRRPRDRFGAPLPHGAVDEMPGRVDPATVCATVADALAGAAERWAEERFFEAHEFYEWAWKGPVTPDRDRPFLKGMAQVAVGCCHAQRGNVTGSRTLLERGIGHIAAVGPAHLGIDVEALVGEVRRLLADLDDLDGARPSPAMAFPALPTTSLPSTGKPMT